jgi:serine/threonine-protein kinase RsbW
MSNRTPTAMALGNQDHALDLTVPADVERVRDLREAARTYAEQHGVLRPDDVALAVGEACCNVVVHAYLDSEVGEMGLHCECTPTAVEIVVADHGNGLVPRPDSPGLGLGLPIIAQLADEFEVSDRGHTGTRVRMGFASNGHVVH